MTVTREHLELAALAAGKRIIMAPIGRDTFEALDVDTLMAWRPHLDDGDAARMAVRLDMDVAMYRSHVSATHGSLSSWIRPKHDGTEPDKLRAWREAVTLCAAAVGERMKGGA